jgi:hypothetical protein
LCCPFEWFASQRASWQTSERERASGGSGIRTREGVAPLHALQACPFVRSGKPPERLYGTAGAGRTRPDQPIRLRSTDMSEPPSRVVGPAARLLQMLAEAA